MPRNPHGDGRLQPDRLRRALREDEHAGHGAGHIYHYPNVAPDVHAAFIAAPSKGKYFKDRIRPLGFKKYPAPKSDPKQA